MVNITDTELAAVTPMACTGWLQMHNVSSSKICCVDCHDKPSTQMIHFRKINERQYRVCCIWRNICMKDLKKYSLN